MKMGVCADVFYKLAHARIVRLLCMCVLFDRERQQKKERESELFEVLNACERTKNVYLSMMCMSGLSFFLHIYIYIYIRGKKPLVI